MSAQASEETRRGARRSAMHGLMVVAAMGALSFAAVPLYDWFCRVTGFGGTISRAEMNENAVSDRTIKVLFDASAHRDMPWEFRPAQREMTVRIGETALAFYTAKNPTDEAITGTASFNVAPLDIGGYFSKIECFCFTEQTLAPGQEVMMPVTFFVDPEILEDAEHRDLASITLSYTFFRQEAVSAAETAASGGRGS